MGTNKTTKRRSRMIRKAIGLILVIGAGILAVVLFMGGKLIFPHVTGPITLAVIGAILLTVRGKSDNPAK
jgi:hypothetical protein